MAAVQIASTVSAMVAIMRRGLVGRLRLCRVRTSLGSRPLGRSLLRRDKERRRRCQQEELNDTFHGNSPKRNLP